MKDPTDPEKFLIVKRPSDDPDLKDAWGLPAVTLLPGEMPEDGARRACREKLGCRAMPVRFLGSMTQRRNTYDLVLMDIEMVLASGEEASSAKAQTEGTVYVAHAWTTDPLKLMPSAKHGSCCSSIFLTDRGLLDRDTWIASLEGSDIVG